ncbi:MAG: DUF1015 domain-containing protein [Candidatus Omnitrophota bacterium]
MSSTIKPFKATYYNSALIKDYASVACPPYDVIDDKQFLALKKKSPYNYSNIIIVKDNNYEKKADILNDWLNKQILIDDEKESFYLYEQKFNVEGKTFKRYGILSLLKMDKQGIFPHEHTLTVPKEDRKKIITATQANLSPIFVIVPKPLKIFSQIYNSYSRKNPFLKFKDGDGNINKIWKISQPEQIAKISKEIDKCPLVIADGHHRFEISYDYFKNNQDKFKDLNYILAYITDCQKGLRILPTHRVVDVLEQHSGIFKKLKEFFEIKEVKEAYLEKKLKNTPVFCLGIYREGKYYFLKLKKTALLSKIPNKLYRQLDTYVFHQLILPLFKTKDNIEYTHSIKGAKKLAGKNKTAFMLRAASLENIFKISSKGFRLPQKSTYFYPKVSSGIVIRRFKT